MSFIVFALNVFELSFFHWLNCLFHILNDLNILHVTVITVTVLDDSVPEENKTVVVQLRNPQGGAEIEVDSKVTVTIMENDNVAGVLGFDSSSVLANEGTSTLNASQQK